LVQKDGTLTSHRIAGTETTAGFLSGLFNQLLLPHNHHILDRLVAEIRSAFQCDSDIRFEELVKLPYMTAVIEEGLRIFPSAPIGFVRTVPEGGDTVSGHFIPGGVSISALISKLSAEWDRRQQYPSACGRQRIARETSKILMSSVQSGGWIRRTQQTSLEPVTPSH
jgi:hypothetical protein